MKNFFLLIFIFSIPFVNAQSTGSIVGKLTDKEYNNEPLAFANVLIKGTTTGTTTDFDGLYSFEDLEVGVYTVVFSFVGYETIEISVDVVASKVTEVNVPMAASSASLDEVVITTSTKRESETAILLEQKKATTIQTKIGASELSKKGVSDVATGLTKATGISKESGKLYVRGLGDRYNTAYLNGLPIPSLNPKLKLLDLGIFPTKIVENLGIYKAYSSHLYGDFAGASVDINTKDRPGKKLLEIGIGSGVNTSAISNDFFLLDGGKYDFFGLDDGSRFPTPLLDIPNYTYNSNDIEYYPFQTGFNPQQRLDGPNVSANILAGHSFDVGENGNKLDILLSASFSNGHESTLNGFETVYNSQGELDQGSFLFDYDRYKYTTNTTILGSTSYKWNARNTLTATTLFVNDTEDELREFKGVSGENTELNTYVRRGTFQQNNLFTQQLSGNHKFNSGKYELNYGVAYNKALGYVPDRRQLFFSEREDGSIVLGNFRNTNDSDNQRFYQELNEDDISTNVSFDINFSKDEEENYKNTLTVGLSTRNKDRDFEAKQINYIFDANNTVVELDNPDAFLNEQNLLNDVYNVIEVTRPQNAYTADLSNIASFALFKWQISDNTFVNTGLRVEDFEQNVFYKDPVTSKDATGTIDEFFVLPSLDIKYILNEKTNIRFAASKTVTLPLFTETAPFLDEDVNEFTIGNPDLKNSDNYNVDIKYEYFPRSGEIFSVGAFGKYLDKPIEKIRIASANNNNSFVNSDKATIIGAEIEYKQKLNNVFTSEEDDSVLSNFSIGLNATFMYTEVVIDPSVTVLNASIAPTNLERQLQGASPYIFNADINFSKAFEKHTISTTLDFNYFGDRIYSAGGNGVGDIFEKGFGTLNFNFKDTINEHWEVGLSAKNLLNPTIDRYQDQESINQELTVSSYKIGVNLSLGFTYKF